MTPQFLNESMLKIGTRKSTLAVWQAEQVQNAMQEAGQPAELVKVSSSGDQDTSTPLHQFGTTGIFTKVLDDALRDRTADIAVHSLKDYPTTIPDDLFLAAVLPRGPYQDVLVYKNDADFLQDPESEAVIASGSIRRRAQWKARYPHHELVDIRGNVQTRLRKLEENDWDGVIFAKAGLERIGLLPEKHLALDWMIPAPAQGVVGIMCRKEDVETFEFLKTINNEETFMRSRIERQFLNKVEGGCSAPVGAFTTIANRNISLRAGVFDLDGQNNATTEKEVALPEAMNLGREAAEEVLAKGGKEIMKRIQNA